jgi:hypothetical protein
MFVFLSEEKGIQPLTEKERWANIFVNIFKEDRHQNCRTLAAESVLKGYPKYITPTVLNESMGCALQNSDGGVEWLLKNGADVTHDDHLVMKFYVYHAVDRYSAKDIADLYPNFYRCNHDENGKLFSVTCLQTNEDYRFW